MISDLTVPWKSSQTSHGAALSFALYLAGLPRYLFSLFRTRHAPHSLNPPHGPNLQVEI